MGLPALIQLLDRTPLTEEQSAYLAQADVSARTLMALINDVLDLSRVEAGRLQLEASPVDLQRLTAEIEAIVASQARDAGLQLTISASRPDRNIVGDPLRLKQVLLNLVSNAIKFTPDGSVTLSVRVIAQATTQARIAFEVRDTGIGITRDRLEHLFDPFEQQDSSTSRRYGGTGLGLSIAQQLVIRMGGYIRATSTLGEGSCFAFELDFPLTDEPHTAAVPQRNQNAPLHGVRVLLVDDAPINRVVAQRLLELSGSEVTAVDGGAAALAALETTTIDAVLLDLQMPGMDGYEVAERLRADPGYADVPLIAVTANATEQHERRAKDSGFDAFIVKPFREEELIDTLSLCVGRPAQEPHKGARPKVAASLDSAWGLRLVRGDRVLFARLLEAFVPEVRALLEDSPGQAPQDGGAYLEAVHRTKGTAGILGAHEVQASLEALERALLNDRDPTAAIARLHDAVVALADARAAWVAGERPQLPAA